MAGNTDQSELLESAEGAPTVPADPAPTMRATYDRIAPDYASANKSRLEVLASLAPQFIAAARSAATSVQAPHPRVLEVGCGPGRDMAWMEREGLATTGIDLSQGMLREARSRATGPLVQMDMRRLAFRRTSFHGAWCMASLLHLPRSDAPVVLSQIAALLIPGAPLFLCLQGGSGETWEHAAYGHTVDRFFARYAPDEIVAMLSAAGFTVQAQEQSAAGTRIWLRFLAFAD